MPALVGPGLFNGPGVAIVPPVPGPLTGLSIGAGRVDAIGAVVIIAPGLGVAQFFCMVLCTKLLLADGDGQGEALPALVEVEVLGVGGVCALAATPIALTATSAPVITAPPNQFGCFIPAAYPGSRAHYT